MGGGGGLCDTGQLASLGQKRAYLTTSITGLYLQMASTARGLLVLGTQLTHVPCHVCAALRACLGN